MKWRCLRTFVAHVLLEYFGWRYALNESCHHINYIFSIGLMMRYLGGKVYGVTHILIGCIS